MAEKGEYERKQHVHATRWCVNKRKYTLMNRQGNRLCDCGGGDNMINNTIKPIELGKKTVKNKKI